jgi:hypothetical protein
MGRRFVLLLLVCLLATGIRLFRIMNLDQPAKPGRSEESA